MNKEKTYSNTRFSPEAIKEAAQVFNDLLGGGKSKDNLLKIDFENESFQYDIEEEFFADCRKQLQSFWYGINGYHQSDRSLNWKLTIFYDIYRDTSISITSPSRSDIEKIFFVFEKYAPTSLIPIPPEPPPHPPVIFIGHGNDEQWRDLKDHLHEKHEYIVEAYETGARAGHEIRDVLEEMLEKSAFAILVFTGEDAYGEDKYRARSNVIHELGLFQGRLGFTNAVVLLEEGTEEFSNIHGTQQIRFPKGRIKETFGDVVAVLKKFESSHTENEEGDEE